jgi:hypothetical protein
MTARPRFVLTIEAKDGQAGIHSLRRLLKWLGRRGLRCVDAYEEPHASSPISESDRDAFKGLRDEVIAERARRGPVWER